VPSDPKAFLAALNSENSGEDYLNAKGYQLLKTLMNQRLFGKYKNDLDGFIAQVQMVKQHCVGVGPPATSHSGSFNNADPLTAEGQHLLEQAAMREILEDQDVFAKDIAYQLRLKTSKKLHHTALKRSDLLKPARSEGGVFRDQVETLEETTKILEKDNERLLNAGDKKVNQDDSRFDFEAYKELKQKIR